MVLMRFTPLAKTLYSSIMTVTADPFKFQIELKGKGITPSMKIELEGTLEFGTVCVNHPEERVVQITNSCERAYTVLITSDSDLFFSVPRFV